MKNVLEKILYLTIFLFIGFNLFCAGRIIIDGNHYYDIKNMTLDDFHEYCADNCERNDIKNFCKSKGAVDFNNNGRLDDYYETNKFGFFELDLSCFLIADCTYKDEKLDAVKCNDFLLKDIDKDLIGWNQIFFDFGYMTDKDNNTIESFPFQCNPKYSNHWYIKQFSINGTTYSIEDFKKLAPNQLNNNI